MLRIAIVVALLRCGTPALAPEETPVVDVGACTGMATGGVKPGSLEAEIDGRPILHGEVEWRPATDGMLIYAPGLMDIHADEATFRRVQDADLPLCVVLGLDAPAELTLDGTVYQATRGRLLLWQTDGQALSGAVELDARADAGEAQVRAGRFVALPE